MNELEENKENPDENLVFKETLKSLSKKNSAKSLQREDVLVKTIFRIFRQTYKKKLDEVLGKRRKNKAKPEIMVSLDKMTEILLSREVLDCSETSSKKLAEHFGALIMPKVLRMQILKDNKNRRDFKGPPSVDIMVEGAGSVGEQNHIQRSQAPFSDNRTDLDERIQSIAKISRKIHKVLYNYSKLNLKSFF